MEFAFVPPAPVPLRVPVPASSAKVRRAPRAVVDLERNGAAVVHEFHLGVARDGAAREIAQHAGQPHRREAVAVILRVEVATVAGGRAVVRDVLQPQRARPRRAVRPAERSGGQRAVERDEAGAADGPGRRGQGAVYVQFAADGETAVGSPRNAGRHGGGAGDRETPVAVVGGARRRLAADEHLLRRQVERARELVCIGNVDCLRIARTGSRKRARAAYFGNRNNRLAPAVVVGERDRAAVVHELNRDGEGLGALQVAGHSREAQNRTLIAVGSRVELGDGDALQPKCAVPGVGVCPAERGGRERAGVDGGAGARDGARIKARGVHVHRRGAVDVEDVRRDFRLPGERQRPRPYHVHVVVALGLVHRVCRVAAHVDYQIAVAHGDLDNLYGGDAASCRAVDAVADDRQRRAARHVGHERIHALRDCFRRIVGARSAPRCRARLQLAVDIRVVGPVDADISERVICRVGGGVDYDAVVAVWNPLHSHRRRRVAGALVDVAVTQVGGRREASAGVRAASAGNRHASAGDRRRGTRRVHRIHRRERGVVCDGEIVPRRSWHSVSGKPDVRRSSERSVAAREIDVDGGLVGRGGDVGLVAVDIVENDACRGLDEFARADAARRRQRRRARRVHRREICRRRQRLAVRSVHLDFRVRRERLRRRGERDERFGHDARRRAAGERHVRLLDDVGSDAERLVGDGAGPGEAVVEREAVVVAAGKVDGEHQPFLRGDGNFDGAALPALPEIAAAPAVHGKFGRAVDRYPLRTVALQLAQVRPRHGRAVVRPEAQVPAVDLRR